MLSRPRRREIDHRTLKLIVGVIAISLPFLTRYLAGQPLDSISAAYWRDGSARNILVGFLFAIASFLLAYNGLSLAQMILSKVASISALLVALFPCRCVDHPERIPGLHYVAAAAMFLILAFFCFEFYRRARAKGHPQAKLRAAIYAVCGAAILLSVIVLAVNGLLKPALLQNIFGLSFYGESVSLLAFGTSWLIASRVLPGVTRPDERFSPLREHNPD